jgi:5-methylcytosine-specific restriction endonuclease McrA
MAHIPQALRQAVLGTAQGRCAYCLSPEQMMGVAFEVDHIIPRSAGGRTQLDNLCLSCPTCNRHKARRLSISSRPPFLVVRSRCFIPSKTYGRIILCGAPMERISLD